MNEPAPIERRYALSTIGRGMPNGAGKYLLYSNDLQHAYVLARYEETGDLVAEQIDGGERAIIGTFWRTLWVKPDSGLLAYADTPGRSNVVGVADHERLLDAVIDLAPSLVEIASLLKTRNAAIQEALRRYQARQQRGTQTWGVYDRVTASWPAVVGGRRIADSTDQAHAEADADWLNRNAA